MSCQITRKSFNELTSTIKRGPVAGEAETPLGLGGFTSPIEGRKRELGVPRGDKRGGEEGNELMVNGIKQMEWSRADCTDTGFRSGDGCIGSGMGSMRQKFDIRSTRQLVGMG